MLKMTGKDSASKTKPLPGEQATSAADLTARIVFEAPITVRWSRHDQNDRWAVPGATNAADLTAKVVFESPVTVRWSRHVLRDRWAVSGLWLLRAAWLSALVLS